MNFALPADDEWNRIANLTGDHEWLPQNLRKYFMQVEHNHYLPEGNYGIEGHGFDGYISVSLMPYNGYITAEQF